MRQPIVKKQPKFNNDSTFDGREVLAIVKILGTVLTI